MAWWGNDIADNTPNPRFKNKFLIELGHGGYLYSAKSVTKPSISIEKKEYKMINHYYSFPGMAKWEPISIKMVDAGFFGSSVQNVGTGQTLYEMLFATGYRDQAGNAASLSNFIATTGPEKAATIGRALGDVVKIHQLDPAGIIGKSGSLNIQETWTLHNPIITKISWGDLDYSSNDMVEYTLDITYDWATLDT